MLLRHYLLGMILVAVFSVAAWISILKYVDPAESSMLGPALFYLSLFFSMVSILTLIGFFGRVWLSKNEVIYRHVKVSFRQAVLLSLTLIVCLILQSLRLLTIGNIFLVIGIAVAIEFFFITR